MVGPRPAAARVWRWSLSTSCCQWHDGANGNLASIYLVPLPQCVLFRFRDHPLSAVDVSAAEDPKIVVEQRHGRYPLDCRLTRFSDMHPLLYNTTPVQSFPRTPPPCKCSSPQFHLAMTLLPGVHPRCSPSYVGYSPFILKIPKLFWKQVTILYHHISSQPINYHLIHRQMERSTKYIVIS